MASKRDTAAELRALSAGTAQIALTAPDGERDTLLKASAEVGRSASRAERNAKLFESAVLQLPAEATGDELFKVRRRQSARRGDDVYLPSWSAIAQGLPSAFLRSALFSTGRGIQKNNDRIVAGDASLRVSELELASFNNIKVFYSGYPLCQFDRRVYAAALDYYRERPLAPDDCERYVRTSFFEFCGRLAIAYNENVHKAVRASLLRLNYAQLRMRVNRMNLDVPKLLSVSFEDGAPTGDLKASDLLFLRVTEPIAELFGPGAWTALDREAVSYDGLRGWLAAFYASHAEPRWLLIKKLKELSGYESRMNNFKIGLREALDKLKTEVTPLKCRVAAYQFSEDGKWLWVRRTEWPDTTDVASRDLEASAGATGQTC